MQESDNKKDKNREDKIKEEKKLIRKDVIEEIASKSCHAVLIVLEEVDKVLGERSREEDTTKLVNTLGDLK